MSLRDEDRSSNVQRDRGHLSTDQWRWDALTQNLRVESALLRVIDALGGIECIVLKGSLLTRRISGDLTARISGDNDVLIRAKDAARALARLKESGYEPAPGVRGLRALERNGRLELWPRGDSTEVTLDLHVRAFDPRLFDEDEEFLWSHVAWADLHGRSVRVFDASLTLAHLAAHTLSHFADPAHLEFLRLAWARSGSALDPAPLHEVVRRSIGLRAFEFSILLALAADSQARLPWAPGREAHLLAQLARTAGWEQRSLPFRGLATILAVNPRRLPSALLCALYPGRDELNARYGRGSLARLLPRHLASRL